jgi:isoleucyl-tRNA synthetase
MSYFPEPGALTAGLTDRQRTEAAEWEKLVPIREQALKALDAAREDKVIGSSLEADLIVTADPMLYPVLAKHQNDLPDWFIVSQVELRETPSEPAVKVERARGDRCERCWKYKTDVGSNSDFPTVCASCAAVVPDFLDS